MSAEKFKLPSKVVDADWKDDVAGMKYEMYDNEAEYIAPDTVPDESIEKIKAIDLKQQFRQRGQKIGKLFNLESI